MKNATDQQKEDVIAPQQHYPHPYEVELEQLQYSDLQFQPPKSCSTWNDLPAIGVGGTLQTKDDTSNDVSAGMSGMGDVEFIEDLAGLQRFVLHMQEYDIREMAVDLEAHNYRSFSGFVCLMQISVRWPSSAPSDLRRDLIVDTLALRKHMGGTLLPLFANPQIVKVMHGADSDIQWLQRDFGLYLVNLFDTHQAAITLALPSRGLGSILHRYASVTADKKHQLSDWRQRPLPSDMLQYAQSDTHYLLDVYDVMRRDLAATISTSDDGSNTDTDGAIGIVLKESKRVCSFNCLKEPFHPKGWQKLLFAKNSRPNKPLTKMQQQCLHLLWDWRDAAARDRDESLGYVCSNRSLIRIASRMPHTVAELTRLINPVPDLVREYAPTIVSFVHRAASGESVQVTGQQGITKKISQEAALPSATSHQDSTTIVSKPAIPAVQDTFADINDVGSSSEEDENDCGPESVSYLALDPVNKGFQSSHHTIISSHSLMSKSDDGHHAKTPSLRHAMVIDGLGAIRAVFNSKDEGTGTDRAEEDAKKAIAVTKRILQRAAEDPNPCFFTAGGFLMPDEDDEATRNAAAAKAKAAVAVKAKEEDTSMPKSLVESYNLTDTIKAPKSRYSTQKKEQVAKSSEHGKNSDLSAAQKVKKEASTAAATTNSANKERSVSAVAAKSKDVITPFDYSNTSKSTGISLEGNPFFSLSSGPSSRAPRDRNNKGKNNNNKRKGNSPASGDSKNGTPNKKKNKRVAEYPQKLDGNRTTVTKRGGA
jgi:ribonuclease D